MDNVSWRIILGDLECILRADTEAMAPSSLPFQTWCKLQSQYALEYLQPQKFLEGSIEQPSVDMVLQYWGLTGKTNCNQDVLSTSFVLDEDTTRILMSTANDAFRTQPVEILQAALLFSFINEFSDREAPVIHSESHGREGWESSIDLSQTVGWFTTVWPTLVAVRPGQPLSEILKRTKDARRRMSRNGWDYFTSRYLHPDGHTALPLNVPLEIVFNYHGSFQQLEDTESILRAAETQYRRFDQASTAPRFELFEVSAVLKSGQLGVEICYHHHMGPDRIGCWSASYEHALREACRTLPSMDVQHTLADYPLLPVDYESLEALTRTITVTLGPSASKAIEDVYPCTGIQQGMLLSHSRDTNQYITGTTWEIYQESGIDINRFLRAWQLVIDNNPVLRTVFVEGQSGQLWNQVVMKHATGKVVSFLDGGNDTAPIDEQMDKITGSCPWKITLKQTSTPNTICCNLAILHALVDGFSTTLIEQQLVRAYEDERLSASVATFKDYVSYLQDVPSESGTQFWAGYLEGTDPCVITSLGAAPDANPGAKVQYVLGELNDLKPLQSFCESHGVTLFNLIQVAWGVVLRSYTGLDTTCFGYLASGRNVPIPGIDTAIGPFINMLISRLDLAGDKTIVEAVQTSRSDFLQGLEHQHTSLAEIYHSLGVTGRGLFNTVVTLQNLSPVGASTSRLLLRPVMTDDPTEYDLTLNVAASDDRLQYALWYYPRTFLPSQVSDLVAAFGRALQGLVDPHNVNIRDVDLLGQNDIDLLRARNEHLPETQQHTVHDIIAKFFVSSPSAPAVCAWDGDFTYAELDRLSSVLAVNLIDHGVGPEMFVPIHSDKSKWVAVAMLAVLRAGGAFTLLDPSLPMTQKKIICTDLKCRVILCSRASQSEAPPVEATIVIDPEDLPAWNTRMPVIIKSHTPAKPANAVYAVFTSGSTGVPKGVVIEHSSFCSHAEAQQRAMSITNQSRVLQFSAYTWDVSIMDHLTTFMAGGCVCSPSEFERLNALSHSIEQYKANWLHTTPPVARLLNPFAVPSLQTLILIGETPSSDDLDRWQGQVSLRQAYGPTECTVLATVNQAVGSDPRNVGHGSGCLCWIVNPDDHGKLMPIGAVGELLVEGPTLARGYLNDPDKTANNFIERPQWLKSFGRPPDARLYKTGDLVQYYPDGSIRYVRRKDTQVKLRGQRIEPGEVEYHVSRSFEGAQRVAVDVLTLESEPSRPFLVCFVHTGDKAQLPPKVPPFSSPDESFSTKVALTQAHLRDILPKHMVPTVFVPLDSVPLTSSGKTDRRLLKRQASRLKRSDLDEYRNVRPTARTAPATETERRLLDICADVLGLSIDNIGTQDSFFHLGGDSITAMEFVASCHSFEIPINMEAVFRHRTIANIAQSLPGETHHHIVLAPEKLDTLFNLSPIQQRSLQQAPDGYSYFNQSFLLNVTIDTPVDRIPQAVRAIVERHSMLRARFHQDSDGQWTQMVRSGIEGSYRFQTLSVSGDTELNQELQNAQLCLDIRHGPVFAADLINLDGQQTFLHFVAHHLVIDLASWRVIFADLKSLLTSTELSPSLRPGTLAFQTWCAMQAEYAQRELKSQQVLPSGIQDVLATPLDFWGMTGRSNLVRDSIIRSFTIHQSITDLLLGDANKAYNTQPVDIIHSALAFSFSRNFADRDPPVIYCEGHGREPWDASIDLSETVGWFTTIWPTAVIFDISHNLVDIVRRTKDARRTVPRNGWSFTSHHAASATPTAPVPDPYEILFNYVGSFQDFERDHSPFQVVSPSKYYSIESGPEAPRFALFDVSADVIQGELTVSVVFNQGMKHRDRIETWIDEFHETIVKAATDLARHLPGYSLNDFPLLSTTYEALDTTLEQALDQRGMQETNQRLIQDAYPCSPIQRGILLSQSRNNDLYRPHFTWKLQRAQGSSIDLHRLRHAWRAVTQRHVLFRTQFVESQSHRGYYDQVVMSTASENISFLECANEDAGNLIRSQRESKGRPQNSLWHLLLRQTPSGEVFCDLEASHVLIDGSSITILAREVQLAYHDLLPPGHGPLYSDYIRYIQSVSEKATMDYWVQKLSGVSPCFFPKLSDAQTLFVANKSSPELRSVDLDIDDAEIVYKFCKQHEFTISNFLQVAWGLVVQSYSAGDSVCFGYLTSGRDAPVPGIEQAVGPFINLMPCHIALNPGRSLVELLRANQHSYMDSLKYQHCSLAEIFHAISLSGTALFNSTLSVQDKSPSKLDPSGLSFTFAAHATSDPTEYDITIHALVDTTSISLSLEYWENDRLDSRQAHNVISTLKQTILSMATFPDVMVGQVQLLSSRDQEQLNQWNGTLPEMQRSCVHHLIERHFQNSPSSEAVRAWDGGLSYQELDCLSARLAALLVELGCQPETFIPLLFEKSKWTVVSMVAVMRAGAAFVLLEPSYPRLRLAEICTDTRANIILSSTANQHMLNYLPIQMVVVDADTEIHWPPPMVLPTIVQPHNAVYAVFTSGSTGKPKGIVIEHGSLCSTLGANRESMSYDKSTRAFQFSSYAFDMSIGDHLMALSQGGCVCIPSADQLNDVEQAINDYDANWAALTPSLTRIINPENVPSLKTLNMTGEAMNRSDLQRWRGYVRLVNVYGPAECTLNCVIQPDFQEWSDARDIGRGTGAACWIVDPADHHKLLPLGAIGELLLEGPVVGREYLRNPDQTKLSFVKDPTWAKYFRRSSPSSFYKTGDLARYQSDGSILYMGRKDTQVKLRGQRLELEEVEFHVRRCFPEAVDVVVDVIQLDSQPVLTAFISQPTDSASYYPKPDDFFHGPSTPFRAAVRLARAQLQESLPLFMVPTAFLPVAQIPLTTVGKADRKRLRQSSSQLSRTHIEAYLSSGHDDETIAPGHELEESLQTCVAHVLNKRASDVDPNDSFFYLGGDSIVAMELVTYCRTQGLSVTVRDIFRHKTIRRLAPHVVSAKGGVVDIKEKYEVPFDLSPIQQALLDRIPDGRGRYNQSFLLKLRQPVSAESLDSAVSVLATRHPMLRARFEKDSRCWKQRVMGKADGSYLFQSVTLSREEITNYMTEKHATVDLTQGPTFIVSHMTIDNSQYVFCVGHHLVVDLVSWRIILSDLEKLLVGDILPLNTSLSFEVWCHLQSQYAKKHLEPSKCLPGLSSRPAFELAIDEYWGLHQCSNTYADIICNKFTLDQHTTQLLLGPANNSLQTTPVEIFHAAILFSFVNSFPERPPPVIYNEGHGREPWDSAIDISGTVGWFTTIWPALILAKKGQSFQDVVRCTKDTRRQTPANGWNYFAARFLHPEGQRKLQTAGPMEILMNYHGLYRSLEKDDSILQSTTEIVDIPSGVDSHIPRSELFDIEIWLSDGNLEFEFSYNKDSLHQEAICKWITLCKDTLETNAHELMSASRQCTLSDFPLLPMSYAELPQFLHNITDLGIELSNVQEAYPCSPVQQGILMSQDKDRGLYSTSTIWKVFGPGLSQSELINRLRNGWARVVARHSVLRTIIVNSASSDRLYDQIVLDHGVGTVTIQEGDTAPRQVSEGPLPWRFNITSLSETELTCELVITHALVDGMSIQTLEAELNRAVNEALPESETLRYSDYVAYVESLSEEAASQYWTQYLSDASPCIFPRSNESRRGKLQSVSGALDGSQLHTICQSHGVTLFSIIQLAWALVLRGYTGMDDICFGYLTSGRDIPLPGVSDAVGLFINMLVCRLQLDERASVLSLLETNQQNSIRHMEHQHFSLAEIQHQLRIGREPLFNTIISQQSFATAHVDSETESHTISVKSTEIEDPTEYDIVINIAVTGDQVSISLSFWDSVLCLSQGSNVLALLTQTILAIVKSPSATIRQIGLLSQEDITSIHKWNRQLPPSEDICVHDLILQQCIVHPEAPAVCAWDGDLTYKQLDQFSASLAVQLQQSGVGPDVFVPLLLKKSRWTAVALLAVMRAGGAFILLDSSYPTGRLQEICHQADAHIMLASTYTREKATEVCDKVLVVCQNELDGWISRFGEQGLQSKVQPQHAVYAVFTSGSTGKPKGVAIQHSSYATSGKSLQRRLRVTPDTRAFQFASHAFDVSISDYLTTLIAGACVCVPSEEDRMENIPLAVKQLRSNWMHITPSVAQIFQPSQVPGIQVLVLSGEPIKPDNIETWGRSVHLINAYGPAECSVDCVVNDEVLSNPSSIGTASGGVCWITHPTSCSQLVPIGAIGELLIEGPIVGRGYLHNKDETNKAFIEPPSWLKQFRNGFPAERLYRTGDLVQYLPDGSLRYVGRGDNQAKIHGQRLELEEIEFRLCQLLPKYQNAVVEILHRPTDNGVSQPVLTAFLHLPEEQTDRGQFYIPSASSEFLTDAQSMRSQLLNILPRYMVPAMFLPIDHIPLTASGKVDRRQLRMQAGKIPWNDKASGPQTARLQASTETEHKIQRICAQVLGVIAEEIGMDDDFFHIGGDSISAMKFVSRARRDGLSITVSQIFTSPVLRELAQSVEKRSETNGVSATTVTSTFSNIDKDIFLDQLKGVSLDVENVANILPTTEMQAFSTTRPQNYWFFELIGRLDFGRLKQACLDMVQQHSILRTLFVLHGNETFQIILRQLSIEVSTYETNGQAPLAFAEAYSRQDSLSQTLLGVPPIAFTLAKHTDSHHVLIIRLSHAQYDGLSIAKLSQDLFSLLHQRPISVPADFAMYTAHALRKHDTEAFNFWRSVLDGASMTALLQPKDLVRSTHPSLVEASQSVALPSPPPGITMATVVKTAWAMVQAKLLHLQDLVFGQLVSGRNTTTEDLEDVIGPCINIIPVRVQIYSDQSIADLLTAVQAQHVHSIPYETCGLREIVQHSTSWPRDTDFGSVIHHQNAGDQATLQSDELSCQVDAWSPISLPTMNAWIATTEEENELKINIFSRSEIATSAHMEMLVTEMTEVIAKFQKGWTNSVAHT